jgi:hypothetical protein
MKKISILFLALLSLSAPAAVFAMGDSHMTKEEIDAREAKSKAHIEANEARRKADIEADEAHKVASIDAKEAAKKNEAWADQKKAEAGM